jgi:hypothetical protein
VVELAVVGEDVGVDAGVQREMTVVDVEVAGQVVLDHRDELDGRALTVGQAVGVRRCPVEASLGVPAPLGRQSGEEGVHRLAELFGGDQLRAPALRLVMRRGRPVLFGHRPFRSVRP